MLKMNSTMFYKYTRNAPIEDDKIMVLFDVTTLQAHERTAISTVLHPPKVWERAK